MAHSSHSIRWVLLTVSCLRILRLAASVQEGLSERRCRPRNEKCEDVTLFLGQIRTFLQMNLASLYSGGE